MALRSAYDSTEKGSEVGFLAKLHYNHKIKGTDIAPYITARIGITGTKQSYKNLQIMIFFLLIIGYHTFLAASPQFYKNLI